LKQKNRDSEVVSKVEDILRKQDLEREDLRYSSYFILFVLD